MAVPVCYLLALHCKITWSTRVIRKTLRHCDFQDDLQFMNMQRYNCKFKVYACVCFDEFSATVVVVFTPFITATEKALL
jgi:hypothetical protein